MNGPSKYILLSNLFIIVVALAITSWTETNVMFIIIAFFPASVIVSPLMSAKYYRGY